MAWGYQKSFTVMHDDTVRRRVNCRDCLYYDNDDKSCQKRPLYLPIDGYNNWKKCEYFELDMTTSHYEEKSAQLEKMKHRGGRK